MHRNFRNCLSPNQFCTIYKSLFLPVLLYASEVCYPVHNKDRVKIERCQKYTLRLINNNFSHATTYEHLLATTKTVPIYQNVFTRRMSLIHSYINETRYLPNNNYLRYVHEVKRSTSRISHDYAIHIPLYRHKSPVIFSSANAFNYLPVSTIELSCKKFKGAVPNHYELILSKNNSSSQYFRKIDI